MGTDAADEAAQHAHELEIAAAMVDVLSQWFAQRRVLAEIAAWRERHGALAVGFPDIPLDFDTGDEATNAVWLGCWASARLKEAAAHLSAANLAAEVTRAAAGRRAAGESAA